MPHPQPETPPRFINAEKFALLNSTVRAAQIDGEPWFVMTDVLRALGLSITNPTYFASKVRPEDVTTTAAAGVRFVGKGGIGRHDVRLISEAGLFALVLLTNNEASRRIPDLIEEFAEVLP